MRKLCILILTLSTLLITSSPGPAAAAKPLLQVTAPTDGAVLPGTTVTVRFTIANLQLVRSTVPLAEAGKHPEANRPGEGHLHFMLDLEPLVVWERVDPYTFSNIPPGDHQLMVELVNNDHSSLAPQVIQMVRFRTTGIGTGAQLQLTAPMDGAVLSGTTVTVDFTTANFRLVPSTVPLAEAGKHPEANRPGEGHIHLMLDLQPLIVWERSDSYIFSAVPPGEHKLMVEIVNNDHSSLKPSVVQELHFRTTGPAVLANSGAPRQMDQTLALLILVVLLLVAGRRVQHVALERGREG